MSFCVGNTLLAAITAGTLWAKLVMFCSSVVGDVSSSSQEFVLSASASQAVLASALVAHRLSPLPFPKPTSISAEACSRQMSTVLIFRHAVRYTYMYMDIIVCHINVFRTAYTGSPRCCWTLTNLTKQGLAHCMTTTSPGTGSFWRMVSAKTALIGELHAC